MCGTSGRSTATSCSTQLALPRPPRLLPPTSSHCAQIAASAPASPPAECLLIIAAACGSPHSMYRSLRHSSCPPPMQQHFYSYCSSLPRNNQQGSAVCIRAPSVLDVHAVLLVPVLDAQLRVAIVLLIIGANLQEGGLEGGQGREASHGRLRRHRMEQLAAGSRYCADRTAHHGGQSAERTSTSGGREH